MIKALNSSDSLKFFALIVTLQRIEKVLNFFDKADSYHILRGLNSSADDLANQACLLSQGFLSLNGEPDHFYPVPQFLCIGHCLGVSIPVQWYVAIYREFVSRLIGVLPK